jgi:exonuclease III
MDRSNYKFLSWNVRGLNSKAKQEDVRQMVNLFKPDLVCFQETKIDVMTVECMRNILGAAYEDNFVALPAEGTRGGIVLAANSATLNLSDPMHTTHTVSATVRDLRHNRSWTVIAIYGPQGEIKKDVHQRTKNLKNPTKPQWLIFWGFNLIYKLQDKNNAMVNRGLMHRFKTTIDHLELKEISLVGRKFT